MNRGSATRFATGVNISRMQIARWKEAKTSGRVANRNRVASVIARRIALVTPHAPIRAGAGEEKAASSDNGQKERESLLVVLGSSDESKPEPGKVKREIAREAETHSWSLDDAVFGWTSFILSFWILLFFIQNEEVILNQG